MVLRPSIRSKSLNRLIRQPGLLDAFRDCYLIFLLKIFMKPSRIFIIPVVVSTVSLKFLLLILLAVPTLGVSALLALVAVTGREGPQERLAASHFLYQRRTLWIAAVAVVLGGLLVIVNIGVFVLFLSALWILARGVFGVMRLKAGRPIDNPRSWLF